MGFGFYLPGAFLVLPCRRSRGCGGIWLNTILGMAQRHMRRGRAAFRCPSACAGRLGWGGGGEGGPGKTGGRPGGPAAGSRIAGYVLEEEIGAGGMAVVFRARDERLDRLVALKLLTPGLAGDAEFRRRFLRESRAAAAVDDPHIIPVYEAGEAGGV